MDDIFAFVRCEHSFGALLHQVSTIVKGTSQGYAARPYVYTLCLVEYIIGRSGLPSTNSLIFKVNPMESFGQSIRDTFLYTINENTATRRTKLNLSIVWYK